MSSGPFRSACEIQLQNPCRYPESAARRVRPWLGPLVAHLAPQASSLGVRFVSDREMRRLNAFYRHKDRPTDVLSFPGDLGDDLAPESRPSAVPSSSAPPNPIDVATLWPAASEDEAHLGDIVISVPTARRQAQARNHSTGHELRVLLLHGLLHCIGYDHEVDDGQMEVFEATLRQRWIADDPAPKAARP